jgi:hypothetical protein
MLSVSHGVTQQATTARHCLHVAALAAACVAAGGFRVSYFEPHTNLAHDLEGAKVVVFEAPGHAVYITDEATDATGYVAFPEECVGKVGYVDVVNFAGRRLRVVRTPPAGDCAACAKWPVHPRRWVCRAATGVHCGLCEEHRGRLNVQQARGNPRFSCCA